MRHADMGNALGFVRMLRQAGLLQCTAALCVIDSQRSPAVSHPAAPPRSSSVAASPDTVGSPASTGRPDADGDQRDEGPFEVLAKQAALSAHGQEAADVLDATLAELEAHATAGQCLSAVIEGTTFMSLP